MAVKNLTSLINDQPTRLITLPNPDGISHSAGTRGVLCKNIFKDGATEWGFTPMANKGLLRTFLDAGPMDKWAVGSISKLNYTVGGGTTCCTRTASNGDLIVFSFIDPQVGLETVNTYISVRAYDRITGDYITGISATSSIYQYDAGAPEDTMEMRVWEPKDGWFVLAFSQYTAGQKWWQLVGVNYNTGTQTFSDTSVTPSQAAFATTLGTGTDLVKNNADDSLSWHFSSNSERGIWNEVPIAGSAGAWTLGTLVTKLAVTWNDGFEVGANMTPGCEATRAFRLSNDDIITFGVMIAGTGTNVDNTTGSTYSINIMDDLAANITQSYHFVGETPASALTNKFYHHQVLFAFKIATDSYVVLTQCATTRQISTRGPQDYWPDNNGISHVRATLVTVDPSDNTLVSNSDLGYFEDYLFEGKGALKYTALQQHQHSKTTVMDYWHDTANECVYMMFGTYTTRLNFTSGYAATDNAASDQAFTPHGPKLVSQNAYILSTESYGTGSQHDDTTEYALYYNWRASCSFDPVNKAMWFPCALGYDSSAHAHIPGLIKWDSVQLCGTNIEVNVVTANATEMQGVCSVPVFANPGLPVGTLGGNLSDGQEYLAVTDTQLISKVPTAHLTDLLILSRPMNDLSDTEAIAFHPPGKYMHQLGGTTVPVVMQMNKCWLDGQFNIGDEHDTASAIALHSAGIDVGQFVGYEGPCWSKKNVTTPILVYLEGGGTTSNEGYVSVVSEGWWVAGSYIWVYMDRSGGIGSQHTFVLGPSRHIELNHYSVQNGQEFGWKFLREGVDRLLY